MAKGWSLHLGVNSVDPDHYGGWSGPLAACEYDAEDMASIAEARGFTARTALTKDATRAALEGFLTKVSVDAQAGDIVWVSYSGHGGQVPDWSGDEDDGEDETWCLHDGQVIDDELYAWWARFRPGVRILVLSDSCHSGTVTREAGEIDGLGGAPRGLRIPEDTPRSMPRDAAVRTYRKNRLFYDQLQAKSGAGDETPVAASVLLISGCQDNQTSFDGTFNGAFTAQLLQVWKDGKFRRPYRRFHRAIVRRMPSRQAPNYYVIGAPNPAFEAQVPFTV